MDKLPFQCENLSLKGEDFSNQFFIEHVFSNCVFDKCNFTESSFELAGLWNCTFKECNFGLVNLKKSRMQKYFLRNRKFRG
jgi:uncharacterized protein YjbI with pentapeptide repeats